MDLHVLYGFLVILCGAVYVESVAPSKKLYDFLFSNARYSAQLLPDCGGYSGVNVSFNLALRQVIDLDEKAQMLSVNVWIRMTWTDCNLIWNTSDYGGLESLLVGYADVWAPDLANYDSLAEEEMMPGYDRFKARVEYDGRVTYLYPTVLRTICRVQVTYFPFDVQTCTLTFGSWSHVISEIDFFPGLGNGLPEDVENYLENNEWKKLSLSSSFDNSTFPVGNYRVMSYDLRVQRRPAFYLLIFVFPCILMNLIAILGCLIPVESGEKASLEVTILLSQAVFLLVMSDLLPPDSDNYPLLALFFACSMVLVGLRLILCIFIVKIHHGGSTGKRVSNWTRRFILGRLGNVFCDKTDTESSRSSDRSDTEEYSTREKPNVRMPRESVKISGKPKEVKTEVHENDVHLYMQRHANKTTTNTNDIRNSVHRIPRTSSHQQSVYHECMQKIVDRLNSLDEDKSRDEEWMKLARIVDRLSIVIYSLAYIVIFIVFLIQMRESLQCLDGECP